MICQHLFGLCWGCCSALKRRWAFPRFLSSACLCVQHEREEGWDGRMIPSVKRLSTREEELYKAQLTQLQTEV